MKISFDSKSETQLPLLTKLLERNTDWKVVKNKKRAHLKWGISNPAKIIKALKNKKGLLVNKYPGLSKLCHKDTIGDIIEFA